jgi:hypothetical protein
MASRLADNVGTSSLPFSAHSSRDPLCSRARLADDCEHLQLAMIELPVSRQSITSDKQLLGAMGPAIAMRMWPVVLLLIPLSSFAAPPPGTDPNGPVHTWFEHQHSISGEWCCKLADGQVLSDSEWRVSGGRYEVWLRNKWRLVPSWSPRNPEGGPNSTGHAVVWWTRFEREIIILCFAPGSGL